MEPLSNKTNLEDKEGVSFCCQHCGQEVVICRSCWRNQKYCSSQCSKQAYLLRHRKNQKNYKALYESISKDNLPCAIFSGSAGAGKTHLARALGYGACQKGLSVLFTTAAEMVNQLAHAQKNYTLEKELNKYRRPQVLIIDELGYVSLDTQASNLFFQVISNRHDQELGAVATTNLSFGKFNQIFANDAIAHAIVDRLVNEAEVFYMEGPSYRPIERQTKLKKKRSLQEENEKITKS